MFVLVATTLDLTLPRAGGELFLLEPPAASSGDPTSGRVVGSAPIAPLPIGQATADITSAPRGAGQPVNPDPSRTCRAAVNVLIVGDGYTAGAEAKFHANALTIANGVVAVEYWRQHAPEIRFWRHFIASNEGGISDPAKKLVRDTAFKVTFGDDNPTVHGCLSWGTYSPAVAKNLADAKRTAHAEALIVLANTTEYGGCASPSIKTMWVSNDPSVVRIVAHELGHSLIGPVGAFEGADYCDKGVYRAQSSCMMRDHRSDFCRVCRREVDRFFAKRASRPTRPGKAAACPLAGDAGTAPIPSAGPPVTADAGGDNGVVEAGPCGDCVKDGDCTPDPNLICPAAPNPGQCCTRCVHAANGCGYCQANPGAMCR